MSDLLLYSGFLDALAKLSPGDQKRVRESVRSIAVDDTSPGLRRHNVGDFVSFSASLELRLLAATDRRGLVLVHVDNHDAAYRWAERHNAARSSSDVLLAVLPASSAATAAPAQPKSVTKGYLYAALPGPISAWLGSIDDESELLDAISSLSPELQEVALGAASSRLDDRAAPADVIAVDDELLAFALRLPAQKWRVFLHPRQKYIVELRPNGSILVRGGPGTGKTVALVHRFAHLSRIAARSNSPMPLLLALNAPARAALLEMCRSMEFEPPEGSLKTGDDLPQGRKELQGYLRRYSSVLIDEGQDLPLQLIRDLLEGLEAGEPIPPLIIAYDANQAIVSPSGDALVRLREFCDGVTFGYCYRSTQEILAVCQSLLGRLHSSYRGKDFQVAHHIAASRDEETGRSIAGLTGPEVEVVIASGDHLNRAVVQAFEQRLQGAEDGCAVVVVGRGRDEQDSIREALDQAGLDVPVLAPAECKGLEFMRGVVVDALDHSSIASEGTVSKSAYKSLAGLYVALSRFRDLVVCVVPAGSPLAEPGSSRV